MIARDENLHLGISQHLVNMIHRDANGVVPYGDIMNQVVKDSVQDVIRLYNSAVSEEKEWAEFLFKDGTMIGLNDKLLWKYIEWVANRRMQSIGFSKIFDTEVSNPLPWMDNWLSSKGKQMAPQEVTVTQYLVGALNKTQEVDYLTLGL